MINLSKLDKELGNGVNNFSLVMKVETRIFTTSDAAKSKYSTTSSIAEHQANLADSATDNANK